MVSQLAFNQGTSTAARHFHRVGIKGDLVPQEDLASSPKSWRIDLAGYEEIPATIVMSTPDFAKPWFMTIRGVLLQ